MSPVDVGYPREALLADSRSSLFAPARSNAYTGQFTLLSVPDFVERGCDRESGTPSAKIDKIKDRFILVSKVRK